jgi:hypothetical protein
MSVESEPIASQSGLGPGVQNLAELSVLLLKTETIQLLLESPS